MNVTDGETLVSYDVAGLETLKRIGGRDWEAGIGPLMRVSPAMAQMTVDFAYGDVLSRHGLDLHARQCCTIAMLLVNGSATAQLRFHINGLLNVGGTVDDVVELLMVAAALAGFPAAIGSIGVLRSVITERGMDIPTRSATAVSDDRHAHGVAAIRRLAGCSPEDYTAAFGTLSPVFADLSVRFEFGDVLGRSALPRPILHLVVIAMLAAAGNRVDLLRHHMAGALADAVTTEEIGEVLIQLSVYAGFPAALNAFNVLAAAEPSAPSDAPEGNHLASTDPDRRSIGLATLQASSGASGDAVVRSFDDIAPALGAMIVDHAYGEIFSNEDLDPLLRELAAIATIAAKMSEVNTGPLGVHIAAALNLGATHAQILRTIENIAPYSGYPTVQRALAIAAETLIGDVGQPPSVSSAAPR